MARTLSWLRQGKLAIRLCNPNPFPVQLPQGRPLATVVQVATDEVRGQSELVLTSPEPAVVEVAVQRIQVEEAEHHPVLALQGQGLTADQQDRLTAMLRRWGPVFSANEDDFRRTKAVLHQIPTGNAPPVRERHRPVPPSLYPELRALLQGMLENGVVKECKSVGCSSCAGTEEGWFLALLRRLP